MGLLGTPVRLQVAVLTLPLWSKTTATCAGAPHCHLGKLNLGKVHGAQTKAYRHQGCIVTGVVQGEYRKFVDT